MGSFCHEKSQSGAQAQMLASNGAVVTAVAKNRYAIGYLGIGYVNKSVKALQVNGITASAQTALSKEYPFSRELIRILMATQPVTWLNILLLSNLRKAKNCCKRRFCSSDGSEENRKSKKEYGLLKDCKRKQVYPEERSICLYPQCGSVADGRSVSK